MRPLPKPGLGRSSSRRARTPTLPRDVRSLAFRRGGSPRPRSASRRAQVGDDQPRRLSPDPIDVVVRRQVVQDALAEIGQDARRQGPIGDPDLVGVRVEELDQKRPPEHLRVGEARAERRTRHRVEVTQRARIPRDDAEHAGPVWSIVGKDPRVFPGGALLRKYRIDEIPQLINVLKGEMSFVGPRPERPEFVSMLAKEIPFYNERHMIHPGLTGWAQVCYPYGSSVEDASRKLEYDLYYLKHAGVIFDFLILLDTIRVVLGGGIKQAPVKESEAHSLSEAVNAP